VWCFDGYVSEESLYVKGAACALRFHCAFEVTKSLVVVVTTVFLLTTTSNQRRSVPPNICVVAAPASERPPRMQTRRDYSHADAGVDIRLH
jgi:hypothetical protein